MTNIHKINFKHNSEILAGIKVAKNESDLSNLFFLHGGGKSDKNRTLYLAEKLLEKEIVSLAFDHSGSGESVGEMKKSSLQKRLEEVKSVLNQSSFSKPLTICGSSMGGYIALKMLETDLPIENLILFCPAIYDKKAFSVNFNEKFTNIIRQKESWKNTDIFEILQNFQGNLLIFIGDQDVVIPQEVIELLDKNSSKTKKKKIVKLENFTHNLHLELSKNEKITNFVLENISEFLI